MMTEVVPPWISHDFLKSVIGNYINNEKIRIIAITYAPAVAPGENFTTSIGRSSVTFEIGEDREKSGTISLILKHLPHNEMMLQLVKEWKAFENESSMYADVLPHINCLPSISKRPISSKCIYSQTGEHPLIILEDLAVDNFITHARQQGLDLQHCLQVVEKLAYLHAGSLDMEKKNPGCFTKFNQPLFKDSHFWNQWANAGFDNLLKMCRTCSELEKYIVKLQGIQRPLLQRTADATKLGNFNVLNHGDIWINNCMFSYETNGKLKDCRLVDYQFSIYTTPALDLVYFWATSPNLEVRMQHFDTVFGHYYSILLGALKSLGYDLQTVPPKEILIDDFNSRSYYGFIAALTVLSVVTASPRSDGATMEDFLNEGRNFQQDAYNNERYRSNMSHLLQYYDKLGVLN